MIPKVLIIAGPNGAGKTTFARTFLPKEADCPRFINADLIAAGISPFNPEKAALRAGKIMLRELNSATLQKQSFAFETTLASLNYLKHIKHWKQQGYHISLFFLALPNASIAVERVLGRVKQGGHNIKEDVIHRRFSAGLLNFENFYKPAVDSWILYNNHGTIPSLVAWGENKFQ
ncbi:zeta toxin family protein [Synechococcus lacustris]|uniref:zeta toxin family protein n=1 Tax=Synechococcus lacustris TaxID=2116544 RepID=UPI0020CF52E2|nr:zeta toxin family protein [Synechococcus lacustris]MCP9795216.1 zeta toxin family protein [Synechococcus lacustris L1F-Slac]MCP9814632.1 zeta toxin family protein [Synechococcus lacustris L1E-Slac]